MASEAYAKVGDAHEELKQSMGGPPETGEIELDRTMSREPRTTVVGGHAALAQRAAAARARGLQGPPQAQAAPRAPARRVRGGRRIDWAHAEALAFASLLALGVPIRLTGQDTERGTFSQRHPCSTTPRPASAGAPLQHLRDANAPFELHNSPLSEQACVGFEYGYSVQAPEALVLWEAQFGDFVNSAQVIVDQFLGLRPRQVGPDLAAHAAAAARLRGLRPRALERAPRALPAAAAEGNIRVANCTTPGAVLPPAAPPGARLEAAPADRDDPEEPAAAAGRHLDAASWPRAASSG